MQMGKDLKGKELGTGISQRKDGYYVGRFTGKDGKRYQKIFHKLQECRKWVADSEYDNAHSSLSCPNDMMVSAWYDYWIGVKEKSLRANTVDNYKDVYKITIDPVIGKKLLREVSTMDCQRILDYMAEKGYKSTSIARTKAVLHNLLDYAFQYDIIIKNPCARAIKSNIGNASPPKRSLTIEEQRKFCRQIVGHKFECEYKFALQTGLRVGEIIGLKWDDVDFTAKTITVKRTMNYKKSLDNWSAGDPKSKNGFRVIPLTDEAVKVLRTQREYNKKIKVINISWSNYVFLNNYGNPVSASLLTNSIYDICKEAGIPRISMHILRHTFATRCIEGGMQPKTLQMILGHSNITTTLNLYVHATDEQKKKEMDAVSSALLIG